MSFLSSFSPNVMYIKSSHEKSVCKNILKCPVFLEGRYAVGGNDYETLSSRCPIISISRILRKQGRCYNSLLFCVQMSLFRIVQTTTPRPISQPFRAYLKKLRCLPTCLNCPCPYPSTVGPLSSYAVIGVLPQTDLHPHSYIELLTTVLELLTTVLGP